MKSSKILLFLVILSVMLSGCQVVRNGDGTVTTHVLGQNIVSGYVNTTCDGTPNRSGAKIRNPYSDLTMKVDFEVCLIRPDDNLMHSPRLPLRERVYSYRTYSPGQGIWIPTPTLVGTNEYVTLKIAFFDRSGNAAGYASDSFGVYGQDHWHVDWTPTVGVLAARRSVDQEIGGYGSDHQRLAWQPGSY